MKSIMSNQKTTGERSAGLAVILLLTMLLFSGCSYRDFMVWDEMKAVVKTFFLYPSDRAAEAARQKEQEYALTISDEDEEILEEKAQGAEVNEESVVERPASYLIENFPQILQNPELPTGCESTALTMVLNYYGYPADKVEMATEYLPKVPFRSRIDETGREIGPDLEETFVGDPTTSNGIICMTKPIMLEANAYLKDQGSNLTAIDISGVTFDDLYTCISQDQPAVVWVTIGMADRQVLRGWYTEDGDYVEYSRSDHGAVLIGYTETTVTIADPISGIVEYSREQFEKVFTSRGNRAVILEEME